MQLRLTPSSTATFTSIGATRIVRRKVLLKSGITQRASNVLHYRGPFRGKSSRVPRERSINHRPEVQFSGAVPRPSGSRSSHARRKANNFRHQRAVARIPAKYTCQRSVGDSRVRISTMAFATSQTSALNPRLQILAALEKKVIRQSFETWLNPTRYSHTTGRTLYVRVPSPEFQHIGDKYGDLIQEAIDLQSLELDDVSFVTAEEDPRFLRSAAMADSDPFPLMRPRRHPRLLYARQSKPSSTGLPQRSSIRATPSTTSSLGMAINLHAQLCSLLPSVPRAPTNPLFLYGGVGMGKTPPDACHRPRSEAPPALPARYLLCFGGKIHQRDDHVVAQRSHDQLPAIASCSGRRFAH